MLSISKSKAFKYKVLKAKLVLIKRTVTKRKQETVLSI